MLAYLISDSTQDVRINAKKALLTIEYGPQPLDSREDCINLINDNLKKNFERQKLIAVLEKGPEDEGLSPLSRSMTKLSRASGTSPFKRSGFKLSVTQINPNDVDPESPSPYGRLARSPTSAYE
jgi:hypothetical protein